MRVVEKKQDDLSYTKAGLRSRPHLFPVRVGPDRSGELEAKVSGLELQIKNIQEQNQEKMAELEFELEEEFEAKKELEVELEAEKVRVHELEPTAAHASAL